MNTLHNDIAILIGLLFALALVILWLGTKDSPEGGLLFGLVLVALFLVYGGVIFVLKL